jgi:hypothetical protein
MVESGVIQCAAFHGTLAFQLWMFKLTFVIGTRFLQSNGFALFQNYEITSDLFGRERITA